MAKRPAIEDPIIPPRIHGLALGTTQRLIGEPSHLTATFRGRRYTVTERPGEKTNSVLVTEQPTGNSVNATTLFDEYHRPLRIEVTLTTRRGQGIQTFERSLNSTVINSTPVSDTLSPERSSIAINLLYVAERTLADASPARRARTSQYDTHPSAQGKYENQSYRQLPEYPGI